MPAVVIGPTVAIIGLSLAGNAIGDLTSSEYTKYYNPEDFAIVETVYADDANTIVEFVNADKKRTDGTGSYVVLNEDGTVNESISVSVNKDGSFTLSEKPGSTYVALICGLVTLAVTMLASTFGKKMVKLIPFIIGIGAGYGLAAIFTVIGILSGNDSLRIIDFSYFSNLLVDGKVALSTFFAVPDFTFLTAFKGFGEINASYIVKIIVAYVPVAFVVFAEHIADHKNISSIIGTDLLEEPGLHRTLLGDGVGSMAGALFGGCPNTTYGESVACVAITGNASVATIIAAAVGAIIISFLSPFVAIVDSIPPCVMGGVCMALYGFIAVSGLKMIQKVNLEDNRNLFVVSVILISGIGGLTVNFGAVTITNIACALILGILANLMLGRKKKTEE
ncbi:MAG: uracil-xanthine permease [Ruminococcaceae bacterium]|nr:uracil-xanthine permease [Oscillospiraceae bacterium]